MLQQKKATEKPQFSSLEESLQVSLNQIKNGQVHTHQEVMAKYQNRYSITNKIPQE